MEAGLTEVCKDIRVGKILIQTSPESGEPGTTLIRSWHMQLLLMQ